MRVGLTRVSWSTQALTARARVCRENAIACCGDQELLDRFERAKDDGSWSKQFSKHFTRFRASIGVIRRGVEFHSLRHNVEDALRNANIRKEVRDAIQGHGESGVSREYGTGYYVSTLNEALQKIKYDGLDLTHLVLKETT